MASSRLIALGSFALRVGDDRLPPLSTQKARAVLVYLIMHAGTDVARERLVELFWPDRNPNLARESLRAALWSIRRGFREVGVDADDYLYADKSVARWVAATTSDVQEFVDLSASHETDDHRRALSLYAGDFLEGDYEDWTASERERLSGVYESLLSRVVQNTKDVDAAKLLLARNPYDENAYATLIQAELSAGRPHAAAVLVGRCRTSMAEVGAKLSADFEKRFGQLTKVEVESAPSVRLPFVGRESELAWLQARFRVTEDGSGRIILVHGEPGIGKSALLDRAIELARESGQRVATMRAIPQDPRTFGLWQDLFEANVGEDMDAFVKRSGPDAAMAVAAAVYDALPAHATLVFDDAHVLGAEAHRIFTKIANLAIAEPRMVIVGTRPEGLAMLRSALSDSPIEELRIVNLERDDVRTALQQVVGNASPELTDVLYDRTAGHPLFVIGLLGALADAGSLRWEERRWQLAQKIGPQLALPETLRRSIEARLSSRGRDAASVACALALDPAATAEDLVSVLEVPDTQVFDALDDLLALGVITEPPLGSQFSFEHELVREVAATTMHAGRRTHLHRGFARRLESGTQVDSSLRRARHLAAAGDHLLAAQAYWKAASEALELNAWREAFDRCELGIAGLESLERSPDVDVARVRLKTLAAHAKLAGGDHQAAVQYANDAVTLSRSADNVPTTLRALVMRERSLLGAIEIEKALDAARETARVAQAHGDDATNAIALADASLALRLLCQPKDAHAAASTAYECAIAAQRWDVAAWSAEQLLRCEYTWWSFGQAVRTAELGMSAAERAGSYSRVRMLAARAALWYVLERFGDAETDAHAAMKLLDDASESERLPASSFFYGTTQLRLCALAIVGIVAKAQSRLDEALLIADELLKRATGAASAVAETLARLLCIETLLERRSLGDAERARTLADELGSDRFMSEFAPWSYCAALGKARVAARLGRADESLLRALDAIEVMARRTPMESDRAFDLLAAAASESHSDVIARRAVDRRDYFRSQRMLAAGAAWGGKRVAPDHIHAGSKPRDLSAGRRL